MLKPQHVVSIIIPFHRHGEMLARSLDAARRAAPDAEILVAADGATEDVGPLAAAHGASVVTIDGPSGPAAARNRAASAARGDVLVFVDADVVVADTAVALVTDVFDTMPEMAAVFGAYDHAPAVPTFISQYRNLSHAWVHEQGQRDASTFWAGLGAIRRQTFRDVGGFDERFTRPSVEDVELGQRLVAAGYHIRLDPRIRGTHLKRWTLLSGVATDVVARGIPWTQLIHRRGGLADDLNTTWPLRLSVAAAWGAVAGIAIAPWTAIGPAGSLVMLGALIALNWRYYRWFADRRGLWFAIRVVPVHLIHHLGNGVSFVVGTLLAAAQRAGWSLPGALPTSPWAEADRQVPRHQVSPR